MIRITNTRTRKTITARDGKDAARIAAVALDRNWREAHAAELSRPSDRKAAA